ncbi:MAG: AMP-binding protein [Alcaligenaceae bacterium]|nr:AMP-binding protein [Alcaligenaceae bacterium]
MEKIWLKSYAANVPTTIDTLAYNSLVDVLEESVQRFPSHTAIEFLDSEMSYAELNQKSEQFASWLQLQGLQKGDAVLVMMPNMTQYIVCLFGVLKAGGVMVNCNPLYTARELEFQLNDSRAVIAVIASNFAHVMERTKSPYLKKIVVTDVGDMLGGLKGYLVNFVLKHIRKTIPEWNLPGHIPFKKAMAQGAKNSFRKVELRREDISFLQYTGGTTGVPKSAMLSHDNLLANLMQVDGWIRNRVKAGEEVVLTALPLYHIFALTANCMLSIKIGARNVLIPDPRDLPKLVKTIEKVNMTVLTGVNTLFNALLNNEEFRKLDFSHLNIVLGGGTAIQNAVAQRWKEVTKKPLIQAYGLTETSPAVTINPFDGRHIDGSIGLPIPSTEVAIRDNDGNDLAPKEIGEICVRGPQVMVGYWQKPQETAYVFFDDGFLRTGDVGYMDENGYVFLVDRQKDIILVSGFNVYPNEIEEVISQHPGVREVAAIGVPHERTGEAVKLYVEPKDPNLSAEELIKFAKQFLTSYKVPRLVEFREELPKSNVGKILRKELRKEIEQEE